MSEKGWKIDKDTDELIVFYKKMEIATLVLHGLGKAINDGFLVDWSEIKRILKEAGLKIVTMEGEEIT